MIKKITKVAIVFITSLIILSSKVTAEAPIIQIPETPREQIEFYAELYNTDKSVLLKVAQCESSFRPDVYGDGGSAYGIFQYHKKTFERFADLMGIELNYKSAQDQIMLTAWIFKNYPQYRSHWTCYSKFY